MRWVFRVIGLLVVLVAIAIGALFLLPADRIAALVEDRFEASTGRVLSVSGDVRPSIWPEIGVRTGPVSIANAEWAGDAPMVEAEGLSVGVAWQGLMSGDVRITGVELNKPVIRLRQDAEGRANWDLALADAQSAVEEASNEAAGGGDADASAPAIAIDAATVTDGTLIYEADGTEPITLTSINAELTLPDYAGPADLQMSAIANGEDVSANLSISAFEPFLSGGTAVLALAAEIGGGTLGFNGDAGLSPLAITGALNADLPGLDGVMRAAGAAPAALPPGLGQDRISVKSDVSLAGDTLSLRALNAGFDQNVVTGEINVALGGARPSIVGRLNAGALDLTGLSGGEEADDGNAGGGGSDQAQGWSSEPIDAPGLSAADADLSISANSIALGASQFGRTDLDIELVDSRLVVSLRELKAYDGAVDGEIVVNGRDGLSASADLAGSAIAISRLFAELLGFDRLVTLGDMQISVLASGNSTEALVNSMNGDGSFSFGAGELLGLDLVGMVRNLDPSFAGAGKATIFDEITGTFRIVDGVVINENLQLLAPLFTATGAGQVALGGQTLNYRVVPKILSGVGEGVSVPVIISGSWAAPRFRLDLEGLVEGRVEEEIEKVKDRVEDELADELQKRLGGGGKGKGKGKGKNKNSLEDQLKKGIGGLFD